MTASVETPLAQTAGLSLRRNFVWMLTGNVIYALCQWAMIIVLAKLTNPMMVGQFSLGLAIATPVLMLANLQLRVVQATDVQRGYRFGEYLGLRLVTSTVAFLAIVLVASLVAREPKTLLVVIAVAAAKATESMSDIFYGLFQLNDRLDQTGVSMMLRGCLSVIGLSVGLYFTRDVLWGVIGMAAAWLTSLLLFDIRRGRTFVPPETELKSWVDGWKVLRPRYNFSRQWTLTRIAFPLGIVMTLAALNQNLPRYFVQSAMGETELGVFSTMAYTMTAIATVIDAMARSATPKLARLYVSGRISAFRSLLLKLSGLALLLGILATAGIVALGSKILMVLYGPDYSAYSGILVWLTAANGVSAVAMMLNSGLDSAKRFRTQVPMFTAVVAVNAVACAFLVPRFGLTGAAIAPLAASITHLMIAGVLISYVWSARSKTPSPASAAFADSWESGI